jgi:hypothetical protein
MDSSDLQDGMGSVWRSDVIADVLKSYLDATDVPDMVSDSAQSCTNLYLMPLSRDHHL